MNPFPSYENFYQHQPLSASHQVEPSQSYQINSNAFYYQNGPHSYSNSTSSFNTAPMEKNSFMQAQEVMPSRQNNSEGLDSNGFQQLLEKMDSNIQTNNQQFKQDYLKLLEQRTRIEEELKEIDNIQDFKLKTESFENLAQMKATLQEAQLIRDRVYCANNPTEFAEISLIVQDIQACETVTRKACAFLSKYDSKVKNSSDNIRELRQIIRGFNELKGETRVLILKDIELLQQWEKFEWYLLVKLELRKEPGSLQLCDIQYWNGLKNFASTSEMLGSKQFETICQQINAYELIRERTELIQKQESVILQNKEEVRNTLVKKIEVEGLLKEMKECFVRTSQEKAYLEDLLERTKTVTNLYHQRKFKQKKLSQIQLGQFLRLYERLPIQTPEEAEINEEKLKAEEIIRLIENNPAILKSSGFAKNIHEQYQNCLIDLPNAKEISDFYLKNPSTFSMPEEIHTPKTADSSLLGKRKEPFNSENRRSKLSTTSKSQGEIDDYSSSDESTPFTLDKENQQNMKVKSTKKLKNQVNSMAPETDIQVSKLRREQANAEISKAIRNIRDLPKDKDAVLIAKNIEEKMYEKYQNKREDYFNEVGSACKFFGDLNYSKKTQEKVFLTLMEYEHIQQYLGQPLEQDDPKPTITFDNEKRMIINTGKMQIETPKAIEPLKDITNYPAPLVTSQNESTQKKNSQEETMQPAAGETKIQRQVSQEIGNEKQAKKVDWETRKKTREEFKELVKKLEGHEVLKDVKETTRELERKVEARYFSNRKDYEKRAKSICNFLVELREYPYLRKKALKQSIEYAEIRDYLDKPLAIFDTQAREEEQKQGQNLEFDMALELEKLVAIQEASMGSEQLPVWTPPVDFTLPDISGLTIPDKVAMARAESIEIEAAGEKLNLDENMGLPRFRRCESNIPSKHSHQHLERAHSYHTPYDAEKKKNTDIYRNEDVGKNPALLIRRIFYGKVCPKVSGVFGDRFACSFNTYAHSDQISEFPQLKNNLPYFDIALAGPFLQDLKMLVQEDRSPFNMVLAGWVSAPRLDSELFTSISKYLIENKYVGTYSYLPGAEIYLVPSALIEGPYKGLKEALNWVCLDKLEAPEPDKQLLFAICLTDKYKPRLKIERMKTISTFVGRETGEGKKSDQKSFEEEEEEAELQQIWEYQNRYSRVKSRNDGV